MARFHVTGGTCPQEELEAYAARSIELFGREADDIDVKLCGDDVELGYHYDQGRFHRIRRITGYLVGTLDRFNNAKRAEERDRVKHGVAV